MNPFESGERKLIPAVLVYLRYEGKVLMLHRDAPDRSAKTDHHYGKWNGLGGKLELSESPHEAAVREIQEESGVLLEQKQLSPCGVLQFPNFKPKKSEDWLVYAYCAEITSEQKKPGD